jgi:hypothetical protein
VEQVPYDFAALATGGGALSALIWGSGIGFSFAAASLWLALNFCLLAWLLGAIATRGRTSRLFIAAVACAKIPLSYLILYWLFRLDYMEPVGLSAGLASLPAVLLFRGLLLRGAGGPARSRSEEKRQG